ncbi:MAG: SDR family NAD(P)-dependent oxidoreductase [Actinomycetes bacterium]
MANNDPALVTGASSGIGAAFVRLLAERGHDLVLVARRGDRLEALAKELDAAHGIAVEVLVADLSTSDGLAAVERRLVDDSRPVGLLVNNAGFGTAGSFADLDVAREEEMVRLNVLALVRLTHAALGGMLARGRGGIINVSSTAGFQPIPGWATYAASKAFVSRFTEAIAGEYASSGVTITALCPGFTRTEFQEKADFGEDNVPKFLWQSPEDVAAAGLDALDRGRVYAIPGWAYRALEVTTGILPKTVIRKAATLRYRLM